MSIESILNDEDLIEQFKALGHKVRLKTLLFLDELGSQSVGQLVQLCATTQPTMSQQLGVLKKNKMIKHTRNGKNMTVSLMTKGTQLVRLVKALGDNND